jgi:threonylcarbamoyladenosine tRNA methylthiotransferase MtaB
MIREHVPGVAITTDVIAGFPGESEADFEATLRVIEEAAPAAIHAFPYSRRPGTAAALMGGHLPPQVRRARLERLLAAGSAAAAAFRSQFLGHTLEVLWEQQDPGRPGRWTGLTGNYIRVYTLADADLTNRLLPARLTRLEGTEVRAEIEMALEPAP